MNKYSERSDGELVELTLLGETDAFGELVARHEKSVLGTAYKVTSCRFSAEDASQDAFVAAWMHLDRLRDRAKFSSWVCAIAKNSARELVDHYRAAAPDISLDLVSYADLEGDGGELDRVLADLRGNGDVSDDKLADALDKLSQGIRDVIRMHYFEEMSVAEIARELSIPEGTVKWRLSEGRRKLRKEYGIMERTYDENESLLRRVMYQVEKLKLWQIRSDKSGFEAEYRAVLALAETLDDGEDKSHAMADILLRGYWWLDGEKNDEVLAKIQVQAEAGHNDDVIQAVMQAKIFKIDWWDRDGRIKLITDELLPYLMERDFPKSLGYVRCQLAGLYFRKDKIDEAIASYKEVLTTLTKKDVYYHAASGTLDLISRYGDTIRDPHSNFNAEAVCMTVKTIDGKEYMWQEAFAGYISRGNDNGNVYFSFITLDGSMLVDPEMKIGDRVESADGKNVSELIETGATIETPAGRFENCFTFETKVTSKYDTGIYNATHLRTYCPGVGLVRGVDANDAQNFVEWLLSAYDVRGDGLFPLEVGNLWSYTLADPSSDGLTREIEVFLKVAYAEGDSAHLLRTTFVKRTGFTDTWLGNIVSARFDYYLEDESGERSADVSDRYARAAELAQTPREKAHTKVAGRVAKRIYDTDFQRKDEPVESRAYNGLWNFFCYDHLIRKGNDVFDVDDREYGFEWKNDPSGRAGHYVLNNFLFEIGGWITGDNKVWSDEYIPGYHFEGERNAREDGVVHYSIDVADAGIVEVPAGRFENCIRVEMWSDLGGGVSYAAGEKEYYYAPGIGIVKYVTYYAGEPLEYVLTKYVGTGEGYYPIADGLFRRFEPNSLGNGCEASVELTYSVEGDDAVVLVDQAAVQSRTWTGENDDGFEATAKRYEDFASRAKTPREKALSSVGLKMAQLMRDAQPDAEGDQIGWWDSFSALRIRRKKGELRLGHIEGYYFNDFNNPVGRDGFIMVNNYFFEEINTLTGAIWSEKWTPGYECSHRTNHNWESAENAVSVSEAGMVETPFGSYDGCLCVKIDSKIKAFNDYMFGVKEYYYAPGVGLVKFVTYYDNEPIEFVLTEYTGTGDGFFPVADGLFRRYEPLGLRDDLHVWVETTFSVEGDDAMVIIAQCATQDRNSPDKVKKQGEE